MVQNRNSLPSQEAWIHELTRAELYPEIEKVFPMGRSFDPQQVIEESTIEYLAELRKHFAEYTRIFNSYSEKGTRFQEVKIYSIAQSAADFMIFRNQVKLIVSNSAHGMIRISFSQHSRAMVAFEGHSPQENEHATNDNAVEIMAQFGPFRDIQWAYRGERVTPEQVARFYFAEFVRITRSSSESRTGNKVLLDQIKTLLKDKGIDL